MKINGVPYRTIWPDPVMTGLVRIIDQRQLPHRFVVEEIRSAQEMAEAIRDMHVRGAPLIGAAAAWGMALAIQPPGPGGTDGWLIRLENAARELKSTRPTAVNLAWAVDRMLAVGQAAHGADQAYLHLREEAQRICDADVAACAAIGRHGLRLIQEIAARKGGTPVNLLTHCNAGWLACVDHGTATAPIYAAHDAGLAVHVWVDETRPRNQGAKLTAWELGQHGVPHTLVPDNAGGHLMQHGLVDLCLVGADRVTRRGDVANKIGTYLKALAAADNGVPFYVALPASTIDWSRGDGVREIPIELRAEDEVRFVDGWCPDGEVRSVRICPEGTTAANYGFDVTPARLVTGLITERGISPASEAGLLALFPEHRAGESV
ncbi:MAG TPA: S-methyl-5-thioribose-1-phosphate isomerase [Opitutaceae bacterium]|nr:S-methyl-5-thioribose-1-phosphate isomerase [Opitutaceae bacterium]